MSDANRLDSSLKTFYESKVRRKDNFVQSQQNKHKLIYVLYSNRQSLTVLKSYINTGFEIRENNQISCGR